MATKKQLEKLITLLSDYDETLQAADWLEGELNDYVKKLKLTAKDFKAVEEEYNLREWLEDLSIEYETKANRPKARKSSSV